MGSSMYPMELSKTYGPDTFGLNDLARLALVLNLIDDRGGYFVLSYARCQEAESAFGRWKNIELNTIRNISGFSKHRRRDTELVFTNIE